MLINKNSTRNYSLDLLKVVAVIFITNSHLIPTYKDVNIAFATFGMHGNALFFFVSGFLMIGGLQRNLQFACGNQSIDKQSVEPVRSIESVGFALVGNIGEVFLSQLLDGSEYGIRTACSKRWMIREVTHQM